MAWATILAVDRGREPIGRHQKKTPFQVRHEIGCNVGFAHRHHFSRIAPTAADCQVFAISCGHLYE
jgi:hypothetical protein